MVANGVFNSVLSYCMPVWGGCDKEDLDSLQILQNRAAQLVVRLPPRTNRDILFDKVGWLTVRQMIVYYSTVSVFKIRASGEPEGLADLLRNENRTGRIKIDHARLQLVQDGFIYRATSVWNSLPSEMRQSKTLFIFKSKLLKWINIKVERF